MSLSLPIFFFLTALAYATVGFGGGSTYNALLVLADVDYRLLPAIALICNLIVVSGGVWRFSQSGALSVRRLSPFLLASIPAAWIGGRLPISETLFIGILGFALALSGARMLMMKPSEDANSSTTRETKWLLSLSIGAVIGLIAGLVGIGGGIFLAPILYLMRWGNAQQIAAACSLFIFANSLSGLSAQLIKLGDMDLLTRASEFWPLPIVVLIGGQIGSWLGAGKLKSNWMQMGTAILILYVAARLLWKWGHML